MADTESSPSDGNKSGPDQIFESSSYVTSDIDGAVKLRIENDADGENKYPPVSLPTLLIDAAEISPNHVALGVKRDDKWVKWTYEEYLKGNKSIYFSITLNILLN